MVSDFIQLCICKEKYSFNIVIKRFQLLLLLIFYILSLEPVAIFVLSFFFRPSKDLEV